MDIYQLMANRFKARCEVLKLTEEEVAERSGLDLQTVHRLATAKPIRIMPISWICEAIDYPLNDFLELDEK